MLIRHHDPFPKDNFKVPSRLSFELPLNASIRILMKAFSTTTDIWFPSETLSCNGITCSKLLKFSSKGKRAPAGYTVIYGVDMCPSERMEKLSALMRYSPANPWAVTTTSSYGESWDSCAKRTRNLKNVLWKSTVPVAHSFIPVSFESYGQAQAVIFTEEEEEEMNEILHSTKSTVKISFGIQVPLKHDVLCLINANTSRSNISSTHDHSRSAATSSIQKAGNRTVLTKRFWPSPVNILWFVF